MKTHPNISILTSDNDYISAHVLNREENSFLYQGQDMAVLELERPADIIPLDVSQSLFTEDEMLYLPVRWDGYTPLMKRFNQQTGLYSVVYEGGENGQPDETAFKTTFVTEKGYSGTPILNDKSEIVALLTQGFEQHLRLRLLYYLQMQKQPTKGPACKFFGHDPNQFYNNFQQIKGLEDPFTFS